MYIRFPKTSDFNLRSKIFWLNLQRTALILGVLLVSTQIYRIAPQISWKYWLALAGVAFFVALALKSMTSSLTLVLLTSATSGVVIGTGRATPLPAGLLMITALTGIWILKMMLTEHQIRLLPSPLNLPWLLFLVSAVISWIVGYAIWDLQIYQTESKFLVQAGQYALYFFSLAAMYLVAHQRLSERALKLWTIIISVVGLTSILAELFFGIYEGREVGITGALYVFPITLIAAQAFFNPQLRNWLRGLILALLVLWLIWAFRNQDWKGGWLPALVGLVILLPFRSWKLFLAGVILIAILVILNWGVLVQVFFDPEVDSTSTIRPLVWLDILRMVLPRSSILGLGLANYMYYWSDPTFILFRASLPAGRPGTPGVTPSLPIICSWTFLHKWDWLAWVSLFGELEPFYGFSTR